MKIARAVPEKRRQVGPSYGFCVNGTAEESVQGMAERIVVMLTTAHHRVIRDGSVPNKTKMRASEVIRKLAWIGSEPKFDILPTEEMIELHEKVVGNQDYQETIDIGDRLVALFKRHQLSVQ